MTLIWNGTQTVDVLTEADQRIFNIQPGDTVTITPTNEGSNDFTFTIFVAGTTTVLGVSELHVSCSDDDMDGPEDCGNAVGNGKRNNPELINDWILEGLGSANGDSFLCTGTSCSGPGANCTTFPGGEVTYGYTARNLNDFVITLDSVNDNREGPVISSAVTLQPNQSLFLRNITTNLAATTTNTVTAEATCVDGRKVTARDSVTAFVTTNP